MEKKTKHGETKQKQLHMYNPHQAYSSRFSYSTWVPSVGSVNVFLICQAINRQQVEWEREREIHIDSQMDEGDTTDLVGWCNEFTSIGRVIPLG